jgi:hypothetical protein
MDGDTLAEVCCGHYRRFSFIARRLLAWMPTHVADHTGNPVAARARDGRAPPPAHPAEWSLREWRTEALQIGANQRRSVIAIRHLRECRPASARWGSKRSALAWVMVRCPHQYDELMRRAGGVWEPGTPQWLVERRRIGPVIRELERTVDPLFRQAGIRLP